MIFDEAFRSLLKGNPSIAKVIPALAVRDGENTKEFKILIDYQNKKFVYEDYDFSKERVSDNDIEDYLRFVENTGLKRLIVDKKIKNLVDYMIGVEAGLNSNARKNRSGHVMEGAIEAFIRDVCEKKQLSLFERSQCPKNKKRI